ncbi:CGNR zinc finger domain-containing protein [Streptomyces hoynatensis]|uniref:Zf-CGNR multi-domain protein n=1 Tax=Streptomyces hoynatensis TaxID=1141874 RepID=A0A3A9YWM8_9ACTN|nr:CGNR zinc finger domain-containing protein [Streptomyces hoynatensis]RKN40501.1 zf-CGNR multi-domain protein [Streptomyces hoynatensis]
MNAREARQAEAPAFRQGAGRLCLDFIRTLRHRGAAREAEELQGEAELRAWVDQFGPCPAGAGPADAAGARRLREAVHALIHAFRGPGGVAACPAAARRLVNRFAALPVPAPELTAAGELRHRADDPVQATLALIARDALDLVATPETAARLHECAAPDCRALFLDNSRPGRRRWCSMSSCGNRAKKTSFRERAARGTPAP